MADSKYDLSKQHTNTPDLNLYCIIIFIIHTIYSLIFILETSLTSPYLLACPSVLKIVELALPPLITPLG